MSISNKYEQTTQPVFADAPHTVRLCISTDDPAAEIFILDHKLSLVDRGIGSFLEKSLSPGVYKIKVRSGSQVDEELVTLTGLETVFEKKFERLQIASPAPIVNTAKTHEYHVANARDHSILREEHINVGHGSSIYLFARCWTDKDYPERLDLQTNPAKGLTLHTEKGELIADIEHRSARSQDGKDPWAACLVTVDPGCCRLRLTLADGSQIEQTVVASQGWQTQLFYLQRNYETVEKADWRADLPGGCVLMSREGQGFDPQQESLRLDESARLALANGRHILSKEMMNELLHGKFDNPFFGICGAHLLIVDGREKNIELLRVVVNNLRGLVGDRHPDVEALAMAIGLPTTFVCTIPPMLRRSWGIIVENTVINPVLVPSDSLATRVATKIWGAEPFLFWMNTSSTSDRQILKTYKDALLQQLAATDVGVTGKGGISFKKHPPWVITPELVQRMGLPQTALAKILEEVVRERS